MVWESWDILVGKFGPTWTPGPVQVIHQGVRRTRIYRIKVDNTFDCLNQAVLWHKLVNVSITDTTLLDFRMKKHEVARLNVSNRYFY